VGYSTSESTKSEYLSAAGSSGSAGSTVGRDTPGRNGSNGGRGAHGSLNGDDVESVIDIHAPLLTDGTVRRVGNGIAQTRHSNEPTPTLYSVRVTGVPIAQKVLCY
jgi:hypothetical protein